MGPRYPCGTNLTTTTNYARYENQCCEHQPRARARAPPSNCVGGRGTGCARTGTCPWIPATRVGPACTAPAQPASLLLAAPRPRPTLRPPAPAPRPAVPQPGYGMTADASGAEPCDVGFYSYGFERKRCTPCPRTFTTASSASASKWKCGEQACRCRRAGGGWPLWQLHARTPQPGPPIVALDPPPQKRLPPATATLTNRPCPAALGRTRRGLTSAPSAPAAAPASRRRRPQPAPPRTAGWRGRGTGSSKAAATSPARRRAARDSERRGGGWGPRV